MLAVREATIGYVEGPLFTGLNLTINRGDRIGVVGPNGAGKSTLLKMMNGELRPDVGAVVVDDERVGYLAQVPDFEEPVGDYIDRMTGGLLTARAELMALYDRMDEPGVSERVGELQDLMDHAGGWDIDAKIEEVLSRLGAPSDSMEKKFGEFSGGQQSRILLAGQLIQEPDILLLDEPTNNLDQDGLAWLEKYLSNYRGAVAVVSHDRQFLDNTVNRVLEIDGTGDEPKMYEGGYTDYRDQKARDFDRLVLDFKVQARYEEAMVAAVARAKGIAARFQNLSHMDYYRARGKKVDAMATALAHRLERQRASADWITDRPELRQGLPLELSGKSQKGRRIITASGLTIGYDGQPVVHEIDLTVAGRDRIALVGNNGAGKTTLLRAIAGHDELIIDGTLHTNAEFSYLSQTDTHAEIKRAKKDVTMLDWFRGNIEGGMWEAEASSLLVWFGFDRTQLRHPVNKLSPGEVNKLALLGMTYSGHELLLLDEPTNHLDFDALDVIEHVLDEFEGTLVVASHDRQFIGNVACNRLIQVVDRRVIATDLG